MQRVQELDRPLRERRGTEHRPRLVLEEREPLDPNSQRAAKRRARHVRKRPPFARAYRAILLAAGDKSGGGERRFYRALIAKTDERFDRHLARLAEEGGV